MHIQLDLFGGVTLIKEWDRKSGAVRLIFAIVSTISIPNSAPERPQEHDESPHQGGALLDANHPDTGVLFHADQRLEALEGGHKETMRQRQKPNLLYSSY